jgi:nucleoside-diphosphate-sugar epimerase
MRKTQKHAVTGAFGYSGKYIAKRLLEKGNDVITLTNSPNRKNPFRERIETYQFNFDNSDKLAESLLTRISQVNPCKNLKIW